MPAEIDDEKRSQIIYYSALGYTQQEISNEVGVARNTVKKYQQKTRKAVESSEIPRKTLTDIIENQYDWEHSQRRIPSFGDHPM